MWNDPAIGPIYPQPVAEAEHSLVALSLHDPGAAFATGLVPRHFFDLRLREVWKSAAACYERDGVADPITVSADLQARQVLDAVGGLAFVSRHLAMDSCYGGATLAQCHAEVVRTGYQTRELRKLAGEIPSALDTGATVLEVADRIRRFLDGLESGGSETGCTTIEAEVSKITLELQEIQARRDSGEVVVSRGLPTGLGLEQYVPGGIPTDKLTILFGETGTFKTAIKQWVADQVALAGRYVLDFSIEDSAELTAQRFLSRHSGIPYGRIVTGDVTHSESLLLRDLAPRVAEAAKRIIVVGNVPSTIEEAIRLSRHWARKVDLAMVTIDYLTLLETNGNANESSELYRVCVAAQRAAHRDKIAWVLLSQLNRKLEYREDKRPTLGDLYGSSAMQQTCKLAVGIYRPSKYEPTPGDDSPWRDYYLNAPKGMETYRGAIELHIRKNVLGESDVMVPVIVDPPTGKFREVKL